MQLSPKANYFVESGYTQCGEPAAYKYDREPAVEEESRMLTPAVSC